MKKREDLEALLDLLFEYCVEYKEDYVTMCIIDGGTGLAHTKPDIPGQVDIYKTYKNEPAGSHRTGSDT